MFNWITYCSITLENPVQEMGMGKKENHSRTQLVCVTVKRMRYYNN